MPDYSPFAGSASDQGRYGAAQHDLESGVGLLPPYTRSLLRIKVPVRVTLATTKLPLSQIVELAPGSIVQFDKACDEPLALSVGNREIAVGDAVKVGEKFGLRVTSMILPAEKFWSLGTEPERS